MHGPRSFKVLAGGKRQRLTTRRDRVVAALGLAAGLTAGAVVTLWPSLPHTAFDRARTIAAAAMERLAATEQGPLAVIDGDTFRDWRTGVRYRLANIDTPETGDRARCAAEREAAAAATAAARALIAGAREVKVVPTGRIDQFGRTIAFVELDGRDLGEMMIASEHARRWEGRRRPWCDGNGALLP